MTSTSPCPDCGSPGRFGQQRRIPEDGQLEVFIRCRACGWEQILYSGPREVVLIELDIDRLRARIAAGGQLEGILSARYRSLERAKRRLGG